MNNSFWDTVKGQQLADVLIVTLPKLVKEKSVKKTKQYIKQYLYQDSFIRATAEELELGSKIVSMVSDGTYVYVIYEKEK